MRRSVGTRSFGQSWRIGGGNYDIIYLLDVYEHLPPDQRLGIYEGIGKLLAENGKVVLTYPSPVFQNYLRQHHPEQMQIIDEDITFNEIAEFAKTIRASVTYHKYVTVWQHYDYVHTILERSPQLKTRNYIWKILFYGQKILKRVSGTIRKQLIQRRLRNAAER